MSTSQGVNVSTVPNGLLVLPRDVILVGEGLADERQVLRYSALLFGIFYGFSHQRTIYSNQKAAHVEHEYKQKESLIQKAKLEYAKKHMPPQSQTADGGIITDPMDKNFDLEAYLNLVSAEST